MKLLRFGALISFVAGVGSSAYSQALAPWSGEALTVHASVRSIGNPVHGTSDAPSVSANGRFVAFESFAADFVAGDTNLTWDVFVRDLAWARSERVSLASSGAQGNGPSVEPRISADGRLVVFHSLASNLVPGDTNGTYDVFLRDRLAGTTERVSVDSDGVEADSASRYGVISLDGRFVAFTSQASNLAPGDTNGTHDLFLKDRVTGTTELVSIGLGSSPANSYSDGIAALSADGRFVAFESRASNLVALDTNGSYDVFVRDRLNGTTERVSVDSAGLQGNLPSTWPSISADGLAVAFDSEASNLVAGDTNGARDIFVHDRVSGITARVSVGPGGVQANSGSSNGALSADGTRVVFTSGASNLVAGDHNFTSDIFLRDLAAGTNELVSVRAGGAQSNGFSARPTLSVNGRTIAFYSLGNLAPTDANFDLDVYAYTDWALPWR